MKDIPSWAKGVPTKLLRKVPIIHGDSNIENDNDDDPQQQQQPHHHHHRHLPVYTLTFEMPSKDENEHLIIWPAIHHSKIRLDMGDVVKMVIPHYKPKSYSVSALRENEFDVTFKVYPNGRASGFLDRLKIGDYIMSFGKHANRTRNPGKYVGIIVFGVGITEGLPVARAELEKGDAQIIKLLWASRTIQDTFWKEELETLVQQTEDPDDDDRKKFELVYILSRQQQEGCLHGRITPQVLQQVFELPKDIPSSDVRFLSVGTKEMMKCADDMLTEIGYDMPQHHLLPKKL